MYKEERMEVGKGKNERSEGNEIFRIEMEKHSGKNKKSDDSNEENLENRGKTVQGWLQKKNENVQRTEYRNIADYNRI